MTLDESNVSGVAVNFDNFNDPKLKSRYPALDYSHLHFTGLVLNTRDLTFTENKTTVKLDSLAGRDQSGFTEDYDPNAEPGASAEVREEQAEGDNA